MKTITVIVAILLLVPMSIITLKILNTRRVLTNRRKAYFKRFLIYFTLFIVFIAITISCTIKNTIDMNPSENKDEPTLDRLSNFQK